MPYKVIVLSQHTGNFGDEAAGIAMMNQLVLHRCSVYVDYKFNYDFRLFNESEYLHNLPYLKIGHKMLKLASYIAKDLPFFMPLLSVFGWYRRITSDIKKSDYVMLSPCGENLGIYRDYKTVVFLLLAKRIGKPIITCLNSFSDSGDSFFNECVKYVLSGEKVFARERRSVAYLKNQGIDCQFGVDSAFVFPTRSFRPAGNNKTLGLVVTDLQRWHLKYQNIENCTDHFLSIIIPTLATFSKEQSLTIKIIPHLSRRNGEHAEEYEFYENVKRSLIKLGCDCSIAKVNDAFEYENAIRLCKYVFSMRYHGVIFAIKNMIPFVSVSYENKMISVAEYSGLQDLNIDSLDGLCEEIVKEKMRYILENEKEIKDRIEGFVNNRKLIDTALLPYSVFEDLR